MIDWFEGMRFIVLVCWFLFDIGCWAFQARLIHWAASWAWKTQIQILRACWLDLVYGVLCRFQHKDTKINALWMTSINQLTHRQTDKSLHYMGIESAAVHWLRLGPTEITVHSKRITWKKAKTTQKKKNRAIPTEYHSLLQVGNIFTWPLILMMDALPCKIHLPAPNGCRFCLSLGQRNIFYSVDARTAGPSTWNYSIPPHWLKFHGWQTVSFWYLIPYQPTTNQWWRINNSLE